MSPLLCRWHRTGHANSNERRARKVQHTHHTHAHTHVFEEASERTQGYTGTFINAVRRYLDPPLPMQYQQLSKQHHTSL
jgi:hypothetical protein